MSRYRRIGRIASFVTAGLCLAAFVLATIAFTEERQHLSIQLDKVNTANGVDRDESQSIAKAYFDAFMSGCGGPGDGKLVGGEWVIPASEGYAGKPLASPIRIDAGSGAISYADGPSFPSYRTFRFMMLWGLPIYRIVNSFRQFIDEAIASDR